jgi:hypothetical protein
MDIAVVGTDTPMTEPEDGNYKPQSESDEDVDDLWFTGCVTLSELVQSSLLHPRLLLYFIMKRINFNLLLHAPYPIHRHMKVRGTQRRAELDKVRGNVKFENIPKRNRQQMQARKRVLLDNERTRVISSPGMRLSIASMCPSFSLITDPPVLFFCWPLRQKKTPSLLTACQQKT